MSKTGKTRPWRVQLRDARPRVRVPPSPPYASYTLLQPPPSRLGPVRRPNHANLRNQQWRLPTVDPRTETVKGVVVPMFICEFQEVKSGHYFGRTIHPDRPTAERHAKAELLKLGEPLDCVHAAVEAAGYGCADTQASGYGVRIFNSD